MTFTQTTEPTQITPTTRRRAGRVLVRGIAAAVAVGALSPIALASRADPAAATVLPRLPLASELVITMTTGNDDARADSLLEVQVATVDGFFTKYLLNQGTTLAPNTTTTKVVPLDRHRLTTEIKQLNLLWYSNTDAWALNSIRVDARSAGDNKNLVSSSGSPLWYASGHRALNMTIASGHTSSPVPASADLRADQTAVRSLGPRNTCIVFASVAAVEAAYKRAGVRAPSGADLDLSEEFVNWTTKTFFLDPNRANVPNAATSEDQLATTSGGSAPLVLEMMADGIRMPVESTMPYRQSGYTSADHPFLANSWNSEFFRTQRNQSAVNLSSLLPETARSASTYYGPLAVSRLRNPNDPVEIESILAARHEVAVDITGHAVLLVGYDRMESRDPQMHRVWVKDSSGSLYATTFKDLGPIWNAAYVASIRTPGAWTEFGFVGRWNVDYDGWTGMLDVYHLPGTSTKQLRSYGVTTPDRRIGSFYDHHGNAFRANGTVNGNTISFSVDANNPNADYNQIGGRRFNYTLQRDPNNAYVMSGYHTDPGSSAKFAGYARKDRALSRGTAMATPLSVNSYRSTTWAATYRNMQGTLTFGTSITSTSTADIVKGTFTATGYSDQVALTVDRAHPTKVTLGTDYAGSPQTAAQKTSWDPGVLAGHGLVMIKS